MGPTLMTWALVPFLMASQALAGCVVPEGAAAVSLANTPAPVARAANERAGWLRPRGAFNCWTTEPLFVWNTARRWVVAGVKTGRHNCNFIMMAFDVSEDGPNADYVTSYVSFYSDGLCDIAGKLLTFQPGNGDSLAPPQPAGAGGLY
jgi:hypothetical protein